MIPHVKELQHWKLDRLKAYEKNSRTHSPAQVSQVAASIKEFGFTNPILVDSSDGIIAGHARLLAAKELRLESVPVIVLDHLTDAQRRAYVIADNKLALNAGWDLEILSQELADLSAEGFGLEVIGFSDEELEALLVDPEQAPPGEEDSVPELRADPKVVLGEIFVLGAHRLVCGDSTDVCAVDLLMMGEKVDMVFTDPPYGIDLETDYSKRAGGGREFKKIANDDQVFEAGFLVEYFAEAKEIFLWGANNYCHTISKYWSGNWVVWEKKNAESDTTHQGAFELCWSKVRHRAQIARVRWLACDTDKTDGQKTRVHPTQKPVALAEWFFDQWGEKTKTVVDLYGGSGSTLIACEKTNRKCFMMELDPHYCAVILDRWQKYSGKKAVRSDGVAWDEIREG